MNFRFLWVSDHTTLLFFVLCKPKSSVFIYEKNGSQLELSFTPSKMFAILLSLVFVLPSSISLELLSCNDTRKDSSSNYLCKIKDNYDKNKVPGILPLILHPVLDIFDVIEVDEVHSLVTIYLQISVGWIDPGLLYRDETM